MMTSGAAAQLDFDVAYHPNGLIGDALTVEVSTDCGLTYTQAYYKAGITLNTGGLSAISYAPFASSDWRKEVVDLSSFIGNHVLIRFVNTCANGNNIYVDNINISTIVGVPKIANNLNVDILPNPTNSKTTIHLNQVLDEDLEIELMGMNGQLLYQSSLVAGASSMDLDLSNLPASMYLVRLRTSAVVEVRKIVVTR